MAVAAFEGFLEADFPRLCAFAPGRTELAGNHVDHQGGTVLTGALTLGISAQAAENGLQVVRVQSEGFEPFVVDLPALRLNPVPEPAEFGTPASLVRGMLVIMERAAAQTGEALQARGFDLGISSTLPVGGGLSSSAAFELLVGSILNKLFFNDCFTPLQLATFGMQAEADYFGKPTGQMDQTAIALGGLQVIDFAAGNDAPQARSVQGTLDDLGLSVLLVDVHCDHGVSTDHFNAIPAAMWRVAEYLGATRLQDVPFERFKREMLEVRQACGDVAVMRALHYYREVDLVKQRVAALEAGDAQRFLTCTQLSAASSAQYLQNVSTGGAEQPASVALAFAETLLDELAAQNPGEPRGVCRIHGGGFGGSIQVYIPAGQVGVFAQRMDEMLGAGSALRLQFSNKGAYAQWQ